jgi:glutamate racemase
VSQATYHTINPPRILIFDSGVGGLSISAAIQAQYPHCAISYASDNAAFPYGTKTEEVLIARVDKVLHRLQTITQADIIVVACNTASTVALPTIRERFSIPIIGVVPAIKPAARISQTKVIGLLATPGTVSRHYTDQLIDEFASDCRVIKVGSNELVLLAEQKLRGINLTQAQLVPLVQALRDNPELDTVVLACTHFPLIKAELQLALPNISHWVDSGDAIARRVGHYLEILALETPDLPLATATPPEHNSLFTARSAQIQQLQSALQQQGLGTMHFIELD